MIQAGWPSIVAVSSFASTLSDGLEQELMDKANSATKSSLMFDITIV
jgi:hypothetical protein